MIVFKKLRWKNFLATGNEFIEIELSKPGMNLIIGENGSGKSTLLDALCFALFGKAFRNINKPQLLNSINKKDCVVEIEFSIGKKEYFIRRGLKPSIFEIYVDGELVNQTSETKDYQNILENQVLKLNHKSFRQVVVLGTASFVPFMQLPAAQRRAIVEDLLDLQIFSVMNVLLKKRLDRNTEILKENETKQKIMEARISMAREHLSDVVARNEEFIKSKYDIIKNLEESNIDYTKILTEKQKSILELNETIKDFTVVQQKLNEYDEIVEKLNRKKDLIDREILFFDKHKDSCPTCKQGIDIHFKENTIKEKQEEITKIDDAIKSINNKTTYFHERIKECQDTQKKINDYDNDITKINFSIQSNIKQIKFYEDEIKKLKSSAIINTSDDKISELESVQKSIIVEYNNIIEEKKVIYAAGMMLKNNGIKTKIINQYIPTINKLINKYLSMMDFFVNFEMNNEFEETIKSRNRDDFSYESFSEGQKQRIDLAILFTWRTIAKMRNSVSTNILILDEVFDSSLDVAGTDQLMGIIKSISEENSLFVISHKNEMLEKFNNIIKFTLKKNFSKMEIL